MFPALEHPFFILVASPVVFWASAWVGYRLRKGKRGSDEDDQDYTLVLGGTLTLLGLIIGFAFSMAVSRYDQRRNYEEQEANAIGTEYVRADLLPAADAQKVRVLLRAYTAQRILFYTVADPTRLTEINSETARLQTELWSAVAGHAATEPTAVSALVASGMNDVLNSQGYTQAAWWNRIPRGAWALMVLIALFCNVLIGYGAHKGKIAVLWILPIALTITFSLISDIDSPRGGAIRVHPQNLESVLSAIAGP